MLVVAERVGLLWVGRLLNSPKRVGKTAEEWRARLIGSRKVEGMIGDRHIYHVSQWKGVLLICDIRRDSTSEEWGAERGGWHKKMVLMRS